MLKLAILANCCTDPMKVQTSHWIKCCGEGLSCASMSLRWGKFHFWWVNLFYLFELHFHAALTVTYQPVFLKSLTWKLSLRSWSVHSHSFSPVLLLSIKNYLWFLFWVQNILRMFHKPNPFPLIGAFPLLELQGKFARPFRRVRVSTTLRGPSTSLRYVLRNGLVE